MSAAEQSHVGRGGRAFAAAVTSGDHSSLSDLLARDVVLHSAVTAAPFEGKRVVGELYASVIDSFDHVETVDDFSEGDTYAFFWRGRMDGRYVEGADRLRLDADGRVREITVLARPLSGASTLLAAIGGRFASRKRGARVGALLRLGARPLPPAFALLDPVSRWLARGSAERPR